MQEAEGAAPRRLEPAPVAQGFLQQRERADHVGVNELAGPVDRAIDMALGGEIHHPMRLVAIEQGAQCRPIADIDLGECVARIAGGLRNGAQVRRVGELVDVDHKGVGVVEQMADDRRADEAGSSGHEDRQAAKPHDPEFLVTRVESPIRRKSDKLR